MVNQFMSDIHESSTCQLGPLDGPCDLCAMANEGERKQRQQALRMLAEAGVFSQRDSECVCQTDATDGFNTAWTIGPTAMKRTTEVECAEYWYWVGRRDERAARMMEQVTDLTEMRRVARERLG